MSEFYIEEALEEKDWDFIIKNSSQSTLFSEKFFLESSGKKFSRLIIKKGSSIKAGIAFYLSNNKKKIVDNYLGIYGGILFVNNEKTKLYRKNNDSFNITNKLVEFLTQKYDQVSLKTHPSFQDLRPFQWHNYNSDLPKFNIQIRYTLIVEGKNLHDIKSGFSENHKKSIAKSIKQNYKTEISDDPKKLYTLYEQLIKNNNIKITNKELSEVKKTCNALLKNKRAVIVYVNSDKNQTLSSVLYAWDNNKSYFLLGARNSQRDEIYATTYSHWKMIAHLFKNKKLRQFDFEGVNSPKRGLFKLKFGGTLYSYYHLFLKN